jgi:hypothetical protein
VRFLRANDNNLTYTAGLSLTTSTGRGSLAVQVQPRTWKPQSEAGLRRSFGCDRAPTSDTTCIYRTDPDGTVVTGVLVPAAMARGGPQYQIQVFRLACPGRRRRRRGPARSTSSAVGQALVGVVTRDGEGVQVVTLSILDDEPSHRHTCLASQSGSNPGCKEAPP